MASVGIRLGYQLICSNTVREGAPEWHVLLNRGGRLEPVTYVYDPAFGGGYVAPEGMYVIDGRHPHSPYYLALHVSYPNAADRARAERHGVQPGGDIMIHGIRNGFGWVGPLHRLVDWTQGCIAVTNAQIEEIWRLVPDGAVVEIRP